MQQKTQHQAAAVAEELPVGTSLLDDQFTITSQLSAGGFGITYKAMDNVLGRTVVIKECFPEDVSMRKGKCVVPRNKKNAQGLRSIVDMFMWEARGLAKLRHPNIVGVHRAFEENQTAYMVLDLIEGRDLLDILDSNAAPLQPQQIKTILLQLLNAIEKVHDADLLHRDISPDNVLLEDATGTPILIDFGAARLDASRKTRLIPSMLVIKDGYSPQEFYVSGSIQSPCSDLYALGATFYHLISNEAPVNSQARMIEIAGDRPDPCPPLTGRFPGYDPAFLQAIDTAMNIHPDKRLQSAAQWRTLITQAEEAAAKAAPEPKTDVAADAPEIEWDVELTLAQLVAETNKEVRKSQPVAVEPETPPAPKQTSFRPDWVEEMNEETRAQNKPKRPQRAQPRKTPPKPEPRRPSVQRSVPGEEPQAAAPAPQQPQRKSTLAAYQPPAPEQDSPNWVNRAVAKHERERCAREQEYEAMLAQQQAEKRGVPTPSAMAELEEVTPLAKFFYVSIGVAFLAFACAVWYSVSFFGGV